MFLPDSITYSGIVLGIATATLRGMELVPSLEGAAIGFVAIWLPFIFLYKGLLGRTGMGLGDAKLMALAGAWLGWQGALFVIFAGAIQGTLYAAALKVLGVEMKLPQAVLEDIAELKREAEAGDEEAKKALEEDPLTEDEDDAFIIKFFRRLFRIPDPPPEPVEEKEKEKEDQEPEPEEEPRARIPFGPFLILAILELVFARDFVFGSFRMFVP
jgi:leader peptidase (prepilin peptidase)/N-methyltransferase